MSGRVRLNTATRTTVRDAANGDDFRPRERGFPAKVRTREHEHWWIKGLDLRCAKDLKNLTGLSHEQTLVRFCTRMRLDFEPKYFEPISGEQLTL